VSLAHPDVPDGLGRFRIQSWKLNRDYSLDITAKTVTDSMYDLATGNVAVAVSSPALAHASQNRYRHPAATDFFRASRA
jgi:hypothetical protein